MDEGTGNLQADPAVFISWIRVPSDEVAPWVVNDAVRAAAAQRERPTPDGEATVVVVGVLVNGTVGEEVLVDDEEGAALDPPHAVRVAPITTSNPMTCRRITPSLVLLH